MNAPLRGPAIAAPTARDEVRPSPAAAPICATYAVAELEPFPYNALGQGFDEFFGLNGGHFNNYFNSELLRGTKPEQAKGFITDVLTDEAISCMKRHRDQPFFCYVPFTPARSHIEHLVKAVDHIRVIARPKKDEPVELLKQAHPLAVGVWHRVRLEFKGTTMTATLADIQITATHPCIAEQRFAFGLDGESGGPEGEKAGALEFRHLKITATP